MRLSNTLDQWIANISQTDMFLIMRNTYVSLTIWIVGISLVYVVSSLCNVLFLKECILYVLSYHSILVSAVFACAYARQKQMDVLLCLIVGCVCSVLMTGRFSATLWMSIPDMVIISGLLKIVQILEKAAGTDVVASASAGTASYDNAAKTFTLTASGARISWAKLEKGTAATPFVTPSPALELAKCQRYLQKLNAFEAFRAVYVLPGYVDFSIPTPVTMRSGTISIDGDFSIYPFPIAAPVTGFTPVIQVYGQNQLRLRATKTAHGLTDAVLTIPDSKFMLLSNEL